MSKLRPFLYSFVALIFMVNLGCTKDSNTEKTNDENGTETPIDSTITSFPSNNYFPPIGVSNEWETSSLESLGWSETEISPLLSFLNERNTDAFLIIKDGRIVIEEYFGDFNFDDNHAWNSVGKTLTAMLTGIAQQEELIDISLPTSTYLGNGWSSLTQENEIEITVLNQLTMTSGLDYTVENIFCTDPECLQFLNDPNTTWYYHNAPYTLLDQVIENATQASLNQYFSGKIKDPIGMQGTFLKVGFNNIYFSNARSMARFGILNLNQGTWDGEEILADTTFFNQMTSTSQQLNPAYGYLYWLNGKESYKLPGTEMEFTGSLIPNAPADLYAGLGKDDQKLYMVPSLGLVVVRMGGDTGENTLGPSSFDNELWNLINNVITE